MPSIAKAQGLIAAAIVATVTASSPVIAADSKDGSTWVDITTWDYDSLYEDGWSAENLLYEDVYGENGEVVGEVEDLMIGPDGKIRKVIVEGGGFLDIGDTHIAVPWNEVSHARNNAISASVTEESLSGFRLFDDMDSKPAMSPNWRLRDLLGDYLTLADGVGFGIVDDVIFSQDDKIEAIIVRPSYGYGFTRGPVAFPYYGDNFRPYDPYYGVPYTIVELKDVRPFNYGELN